MSMNTDRKSQLERLNRMTDEEVERNALADPDNPPLTAAQLQTAVRLADIPGATLLERLGNIKRRATKQSLTVRYDADIVEFYRAKGKGYQQAMNDALRVCMEAEQERMHS